MVHQRTLTLPLASFASTTPMPPQEPSGTAGPPEYVARALGRQNSGDFRVWELHHVTSDDAIYILLGDTASSFPNRTPNSLRHAARHAYLLTTQSDVVANTRRSRR